MEDPLATAAEEDSAANPSITVVTRIAALEGTSPEALTPPLYSAIDPEALDSLFGDSATGSAGSEGQLSFTYCDYEVCVRSDGTVTITES